MASITAFRAQTGQALDCLIAGGPSLAGLPQLPYPLIWEYDNAKQAACSDPAAWYPTLNINQIQRDAAPSFWEGVGKDIISAGRGFLAAFNPVSFAKFAADQVQKAEQQQASAARLTEIKEQFDIKGQQLVATAQGATMAFDDFGLGSVFDSIVDFGSSLIDEAGGFGNILETATPFLQQAFAPPQAMNVAASSQAVRAAAGGAAGAIARVGPVVGRSFFNRFPNLATGIQKLRNAGQRVTRGQLYSMLRRFGPEFLISAGILTAAAVSELMMAGPGRRRMNPANVKALRRSMRRIKSFHNLCVDTDTLRSRSRARRNPKSCGDARVIVAK